MPIFANAKEVNDNYTFIAERLRIEPPVSSAIEAARKVNSKFSHGMGKVSG